MVANCTGKNILMIPGSYSISLIFDYSAYSFSGLCEMGYLSRHPRNHDVLLFFYFLIFYFLMVEGSQSLLGCKKLKGK